MPPAVVVESAPYCGSFQRKPGEKDAYTMLSPGEGVPGDRAYEASGAALAPVRRARRHAGAGTDRTRVVPAVTADRRGAG
ncbi:hypothetical protein ACFYT4_05075 [Streptomyces sp. NPDC004609]|uniref:hypothetical protein n=1 Tax=Streptomyces sp. NPDC004609 TaxID=3364704 RepID=UPI0036C17634